MPKKEDLKSWRIVFRNGESGVILATTAATAIKTQDRIYKEARKTGQHFPPMTDHASSEIVTVTRHTELPQQQWRITVDNAPGDVLVDVGSLVEAAEVLEGIKRGVSIAKHDVEFDASFKEDSDYEQSDDAKKAELILKRYQEYLTYGQITSIVRVDVVERALKQGLSAWPPTIE